MKISDELNFRAQVIRWINTTSGIKLYHLHKKYQSLLPFHFRLRIKAPVFVCMCGVRGRTKTKLV